MKDTERYLSSMLKHFDGKESDTNWEAREQTIAHIREIVQTTNTPDEKQSLARLLRSYVDALTQSVHSLRSTVALSALGLVGDLGIYLGYDLDPYTTDQLFLHTLRCASTPKKIIAAHSKDACATLLSNTPYRHRIIQQVTSAMDEKNIQMRHYATIYLKTILETHHGAAIERSGGLDLAVKAIKKGLSDASPMVREAARQAFSVVQKHWPARASRLAQGLDMNVQKSLDKLTVSPAAKPAFKRPNTYRSSLSSVSSVSTCSSWSSASSFSSVASSASSLSSKASASPSSSRPSIRSRLYSQPTVRTTSPLSSLPSSSQKLTTTTTSSSRYFPSPSRSSSTTLPQIRESAELASSPSLQKTKLASLASPIRVPRKRVHDEEEEEEQHHNQQEQDMKLKSQRHTMDDLDADRSHGDGDEIISSNYLIPIPDNNTHHQGRQHSNSQLAVAALLQMLRSNDVNSNCRAIRRLFEKLRGRPSLYNEDESKMMKLPTDVPTTADLGPILADYLTRETDDVEYWRLLMSWDCLIGIYTRVVDLKRYLPMLILAASSHISPLKNRSDVCQQNNSIKSSTCRIGLKRLRMYLGAYDAELPKHLLAILTHPTDYYVQDQKERNTTFLYIAEWMDELVCEYVGLGKDGDDEQHEEDITLVKEGSDEYFEQDGNPAYPWFDDEQNIQQAMSQSVSLLETCISQEQDQEAQLKTMLTTLVGRLRLSNERAFDLFSERCERAMQQAATSQQSSMLMTRQQQGGDWKIDFETVDAIPDEEESSGATQELSKMDLKTDKNSSLEYGGAKVVADLEIPSSRTTTTTTTTTLSSLSSSSSSLLPAPPPPPPTAREIQSSDYNKLRDILFQTLGQLPSKEAFATCQRISAKTPVFRAEQASANFCLWTSTTASTPSNKDTPSFGPFIMLLEKIMTCVSERDENKAIEALHLAMTLLRNQPAVLQYYQEATTTTTTTTNKEGTDDCTSSIAYLLAGVLQRTAASSLIRLSSVADRAFVELLSVLSDKEKLQIIGSLLREWLENNEQKSAVRALFVCLSKAVASNVSRATLEATLDPTILIKGYNHTELVVRRACVQAIVEMYKILGEGFLMTYLAPSLRIDQVSLLRHYIGCSSSSSSSS